MQQMRIMEILRYGCSLGMLTWNTILDIRNRKISLPVTGGGIALGLLMNCLERLITWEDLLGLMVFAVFGGLSLLTHQAVGFGDAITVLAVCVILGGKRGLSVILCGLMLAGIYAIYLLVCRHHKKNEELPFLPFLLIGDVLMMAISFRMYI